MLAVVSDEGSRKRVQSPPEAARRGGASRTGDSMHGGRDMATVEDWKVQAPGPPRPREAKYDWDVFLSYRSVNRPWVIQLYDALRQLGFDVFLDQYVLKPSDVLVGGLQKGLARSAAGVMVWSSATEDSKWCEREYLAMESRRTRDPDTFHYVVSKLDDTPLPELAGEYIYIDFADCREGPRGTGLLRLLHGVLGRPLPDAAVRLATQVDKETSDALAAVRGARLNGSRQRLLQLADSDGLAWVTYPLLGCQVADALIGLKGYDDALAVLDRLSARFPESIRPKQLRGLALARKGEWEAAQDVLAPLVQAGERDPETLGIYARTWMDRYRTSGYIYDLLMSRDLYAEAFRGARAITTRGSMRPPRASCWVSSTPPRSSQMTSKRSSGPRRPPTTTGGAPRRPRSSSSSGTSPRPLASTGRPWPPPLRARVTREHSSPGPGLDGEVEPDGPGAGAGRTRLRPPRPPRTHRLTQRSAGPPTSAERQRGEKVSETNAIKLSVNQEPLCTCDQFRWGLL